MPLWLEEVGHGLIWEGLCRLRGGFYRRFGGRSSGYSPAAAPCREPFSRDAQAGGGNWARSAFLVVTVTADARHVPFLFLLLFQEGVVGGGVADVDFVVAEVGQVVAACGFLVGFL